MAKKKKDKEKETNIENFYDLRTDAVDDLVEALRTGQSKEDVSTDITEITGEQIDAKPGSKKTQFDPYRRDKLASLPTWLKAIFIKWWFAGCVCYFIMMGLGSFIASDLDLWFLTALTLGIVVDLFVNPIYHYMQSPEKEYDPYMMFPFPFKAFWTFFTNIFYYFIVMFIVNLIMSAINLGIKAAGGEFAIWLSPLVFATLTTAVDMAFIGIKDLIVYLVKRGKAKKALAAEELEFGAGQQINATDAKAEEDGLTNSASAEQPDEDIDEVERLRRLAQADDEAKTKSKNKKK